MMPRRTQIAFLILIWLAVAFRFHSLFANTFHADEALFASWARLIAVWRDPLLQTQLVDKPPLLFYLQAFFFPFFGPVEWAARLPNFIASLLLVPLVGLLAWRLYRQSGTAVLAAAFIALSPAAIQFSATAFLDPLLTTLLIAALALTSSPPHPLTPSPCHLVTLSPATEGRHHLVTPSGLLFGLAVATKYQAWLFLPLLAGLAWLNGWSWPAWRRWLAGFVPILMLVGLWQVARTGPALWAAQMANYGGLRLAWSWELWPRLLAWGDQWRLAVGSMLWLVALAVALVIVAFRHTRDRTRAIDQLLLLYLAGYLLLHWLLAVPIWDRYLLPLIPLAALIFGRGMQEIVSASAAIRLPSIAWRGERRWLLLSFLLLLFQLPVADQARHGRFPIGGQPAADQGAAHVAVFLADAAYGTVLYDHWYSWQWRYHLFDSRVHVSWFPYPDALAEDLAVFGRASASRYLALPDAAAALPVKRAVTAAGFSLHPVPLQTQTGIILYQILPQEVIR